MLCSSSETAISVNSTARTERFERLHSNVTVSLISIERSGLSAHCSRAFRNVTRGLPARTSSLYLAMWRMRLSSLSAILFIIQERGSC